MSITSEAAHILLWYLSISTNAGNSRASAKLHFLCKQLFQTPKESGQKTITESIFCTIKSKNFWDALLWGHIEHFHQKRQKTRKTAPMLENFILSESDLCPFAAFDRVLANACFVAFFITCTCLEWMERQRLKFIRRRWPALTRNEKSRQRSPFSRLTCTFYDSVYQCKENSRRAFANNVDGCRLPPESQIF